MTNDELKELLARAICADYYDSGKAEEENPRRVFKQVTKDNYVYAYSHEFNEAAQAVIDALTPMMREFVGSIQDLMPLEIVQGDCFQRTNPHTKLMGNSSMAWAVSNGDRSAHKIRERIFTLSEALASLPDCWREKGGA
jgi:hypothetical protein